MSVKIFPTLKNYKTEYLPKDILSGIIMAAVSIPISMGYAQIAGVPAVYGLYGSVLPILLFAMLSTSKQFIFGVDAAPAAIVGAALATLGVTAESAQALQYVPLIALFTGLWLLLFYLLHADKIVDFISTPVMGGFISGIAVTIIMMQIPKLMGSPAGTGEFIELAEHIFQAITKINWLSFGMGIGALVILIVSKKLIPKFPMAIVIMIAGVLSTIVFHVNQYGVVLLQAVQPGLPRLIFPDFTGINLTHFRFALSLVRSRQLAEDIEAETFLNIMQSACGYKPGTNARAWIFAIARNCCMDCMKENARLLTVDSESLDLLPGDTEGFEQTENAMLALEALKTLSETERQIVSLYLYSGLKQTEIAKVLNLPYLSVRSKYGYALTKLRRYFDRKGVHTDEA